MPYFRILLLGFLLIAPLGCGGKSEDKTDKTDKTTAEANPPGAKTNAPETKTPAQQANNAPKTNTSNNTPKTNTGGQGFGSLPAEFAMYRYIPQNSVLLLSARPSAVLSNELLKSLPLADQLKEFQDKSGIDPKTIDRVTLAMWPGDGHLIPGVRPEFPEEEFDKADSFKEEIPKEECDAQPGDDFFDSDVPPDGPGGPGMAGPPKMDGVAILQFSQNIDLKAVEAKMPGDETDGTHNGIKYRLGGQPDAPAYYMPDNKTVVLTHRDDMAEVLDNPSQAKVVQTALKSGLNHDLAVVTLLDSFRDQLRGPAAMADQQIVGVGQLPDQLEATFVYIDLKDGVDLQILVDANDEKAPQTIDKAYKMGYGLLGAAVAFQVPAMVKGELGEDLGGDVVRIIQQVYQETKGEPLGKQYKISMHVPKSAGDLIPKLIAIQQEKVKAMQAKFALQEISFAIFNYSDTFDSLPFPSGRADAPEAEKGKLSWRVHLLPYLGEEELYRKFKLDEAWDSENNKALLLKMPDAYKVSDEAKPGHTQYVAPAGKGFIVDGDAVRKFEDIKDGSSNTIIVLTVKPDKAEPWTKPGGFAFDPAKDAASLGGAAKGFNALFGDGHVQNFENLDANTLKALLTISGGEPIDPSVLFGDDAADFPPSFEEEANEAVPVENAAPKAE